MTELGVKVGLSTRLAAVACAAGLASVVTLLAFGIGAGPMLAAGAVCALVVAVLGLLLLVRPMRRLADSVTALDQDTRAVPGGDLAQAAQTVAAIARQLRLAEWRQARLGAVAAGAAAVSHDLRGTLAPALLAAERLQLHADPGIKRIGDITMRAVERAIELVRGGLDFAREGHQARPPDRFALGDAVAEAVARAALPGVAVAVTQEEAVEVSATRAEIVRSLCHMLRHRGAAPATTVAVVIGVTPNAVTLDVAGDGPLAAAPFSPFDSEAGLQLAIARDLARSNGGSLVLEREGPRGPALRLSLPAAAARPAVSQPAA